MNEHTIQLSIAAYLDRVLPPDQRVFAVANNPRSKVSGAFEKARGMKKGVPDLHLVGRVIGMMEVKREGQRLRPEQRDWANFCFVTGMNHAVVRSIDDVRQVLREWGVETREV